MLALTLPMRVRVEFRGAAIRYARIWGGRCGRFSRPLRFVLAVGPDLQAADEQRRQDVFGLVIRPNADATAMLLDVPELFANPLWVAPAIQNSPNLNLIACNLVIDGIGKTAA
jgi:hypothetical protein